MVALNIAKKHRCKEQVLMLCFLTFRSGRIYAIDTVKNPRAPTFHKAVEPEEILGKTGLAYPHTAHCLASGDIMVSCLGDKDGSAEGNGFLLLDSEFNVKGRYCRSPFAHKYFHLCIPLVSILLVIISHTLV